jgi:hypothetical protein
MLFTASLVAMLVGLLAGSALFVAFLVVGGTGLAIAAGVAVVAPSAFMLIFSTQIARSGEERDRRDAATRGLEFSHADPFELWRLPLLVFRDMDVTTFDVEWGATDVGEITDFTAWVARSFAGQRVAGVVMAAADLPGGAPQPDTYACAIAELSAPVPRVVIAEGRNEKKLARRQPFDEISGEAGLADRYVIRAEDAAMARRLVSDPLRSWLVKPRDVKTNFEVVERWAVCYWRHPANFRALTPAMRFSVRDMLAEFLQHAGDALPPRVSRHGRVSGERRLQLRLVGAEGSAPRDLDPPGWAASRDSGPPSASDPG